MHNHQLGQDLQDNALKSLDKARESAKTFAFRAPARELALVR
jgi:hypothetical protein